MILAAVPCGNGGFGAKGALVDLPDCFIHGHRQNVNAQKNLSVHGGQLCDQRILDIAGIVPKIHHPPKLSVHGEVVPFHRNAVGADGILKAVPTLLGFLETKGILFPGILPENATEYFKTLFGSQRFAVGTQPGELGNQVRADPRKVAAGIGQAPGYSYRHIFVLTIGVLAADLSREHLVVLTAVMIQLVIPERNPAVLPYRGKVHAPVVDGDFYGCIVVQAVQEAAIGHEHGALILLGGHCIVDVLELKGFGEPILPHQKQTVRIDCPDGDHVLHPVWNPELLLFLPVALDDGFQWRFASSVMDSNSFSGW